MTLRPESALMKLSGTQKDRIKFLNEKNFFHFEESDSCFCCGGNSFTRLASKDRYGFELSYLTCDDCGYLFANPYYSEDCLSEFYSEHYSIVYGRKGSEQQVFEAEYLNAKKRVWTLVKKHADSKNSILDFGCAYGGALLAFPKHWKRLGFDYDESQLDYGRKYGLDLRSIHALDQLEEPVDVIMLNQVLEHVRDPIVILKKLITHLRDDGVIYIEVPGFETIFKNGIDPRLAFKNAHRHFFCLSSLSQVADRAGLELLEGDESVRALLRKKSGRSKPPTSRFETISHTPPRDWVCMLTQEKPETKKGKPFLVARLKNKLSRGFSKLILRIRLRLGDGYV